MRKITKLMLVLALIAMSFAIAASAANLKDIEKHWAKEHIEYGVEKGYISGYGDDTFLPDKTVTRAEFSKMINNAVKITSTGSAQANFKDVVKTEWYVIEVKRAENAGYITGYEDGTFRPNNTLTRQEAAVILSRIVLPISEREDVSSFKDSSAIDSWAEDAVAMIAAKGYIKGDDFKNFNPKKALTRAEAAKLIAEFIKNENVKNKNTSVVPTDNGKDIIYSDILFTDDVTIQIAKGVDVTVVFKNCRILGELDIKTADAVVELQNTQAKEINISADGVELDIDNKSTVKKVEIDNPCTITGEVGTVELGDDLEGGTVKLDEVDTIEVDGDAIISVDSCKKVIVNKKSSLVIQKGTIKDLEVTSTAKGSTINLAKNAVVEKATNKAAVSYVGSGTIQLAKNDVKDVSYDEDLVIKKTEGNEGNDSDDKDDESNDGFFKDVTVSPTKNKKNVSVTSKITLKFDQKVLNGNGKSVTGAYIEENFEIRRGSETGSKTAFTASITSGKNILLTPNSDLREGVKYYVIIPKGVLTYEDKTENDKYVTYFTTIGADDDDDDSKNNEEVTIKFDPENKEKAPVDTQIKITFDTKVYRNSSKSELTSSYCEDVAFEIREDSSTKGDKIGFTAEINSTGKVVTLTPDSLLKPDTKYYVIVVGGKLYNGDKKSISKETSYFTTDNGISVSITPEDGETVPGGAKVILEFAQDIYNEYGSPLTEDDIFEVVTIYETKKNVDTNIISISDVTLSPNGRKATITPEEGELISGKTYYVVIEDGVFFSEDGESENEAISSSFKVASAMVPTITPYNGEKGVDAGATVQIKFGEALHAYVATGSIKKKDAITNENIEEYLDKQKFVTFKRNDGKRSVAFDIEISDDGKTITLTPSDGLMADENFTVTLKDRMFYGSGTKYNGKAEVTFYTTEVLTPAFAVDGVTLKEGDDDIDVKGELVVSFDEKIFDDAGKTLTWRYIHENVVKLYNGSEEVPFTVKYTSGNKFTVVPDEDLIGGEEYTIKVFAGTITNNDGISNQGQTITFKTEKKIVKETVITPKKNATKVEQDAIVTIEFASPIYQKGKSEIEQDYLEEKVYITLGTKSSKNGPIDAEVEISEDHRTITITPAEPLELGKKYYVYLDTGFVYEDDSKVSVISSHYFTVTTVAAEPEVPEEPETPVVPEAPETTPAE